MALTQDNGKFGAVMGLKELDAKLAELGAKTGARLLRQAVRAAMKPVLEDAKRSVPVGTKAHFARLGRGKGRGQLVAPGFAKRSLRIVTGIDKQTKQVFALVGVQKKAFYAVQFWEYGTPWMARRPWLGKTLTRNASLVVSSIGGEVRKRIERIARKGRSGK